MTFTIPKFRLQPSQSNKRKNDCKAVKSMSYEEVIKRYEELCAR